MNLLLLVYSEFESLLMKGVRKMRLHLFMTPIQIRKKLNYLLKSVADRFVF